MTLGTKQAIAIVLAIVVGGGLLSLLLGQGFWGEKRPTGTVIDGDTVVPPMSPACGPGPCAQCHPNK